MCTDAEGAAMKAEVDPFRSVRQLTNKDKKGTLLIILYKNDQCHIQSEMVGVDFVPNPSELLMFLPK